jgi:Na+/melibiose symporter-like transporter
MKPERKKHLFDNPRNVSRLLGGFYVICLLLLMLDFILHRHAALRWEGFTGFYALFGFIACVVLVLLAKQLRRVLMRKEDYYDVDK